MKFSTLFLALLASPAFGGVFGFPDYPKETLPTIEALPAKGSLILDVRSAYFSGPALMGDPDVEVGVFDLIHESESVWKLPPGMPLTTRKFHCTSCTTASWSAGTRQLLLTLANKAYLLDGSGHFNALDLEMPGVSVSFESSDEFAISADGQLVAFRVYTRDRGDNAPDPTDPYWAPNSGRLYNDLVYERIEGSKPITISKVANYAPPAWSPDHKRIAYSKRVEKADQELTVFISNLEDAVASQPTSIPVPHIFTTGMQTSISEIRWNPTHDVLGFIVREDSVPDPDRSKGTLYTVNADGSNLTRVAFSKRDFEVFAFAWSPTGNMLALRSNFEAKKICSLNPLDSLGGGGRPCITSQQVFISNTDGSGLKRISKQPKFRRGELFWVQ